MGNFFLIFGGEGRGRKIGREWGSEAGDGSDVKRALLRSGENHYIPMQVQSKVRYLRATGCMDVSQRKY